MIQFFVTPVLKRNSINTQYTPGVFLQNSSTLGLVSRRHIHNYFIPVLYKQKESVTQTILIQFLVATLHNHANSVAKAINTSYCKPGTKETSPYLLVYS